MKNRILYLSYDGMLEPLGASQVLSYVKKLSKDYSFHLISLEKPEDFANKNTISLLQSELAEYDITWLPLPYKIGANGYLANIKNMYRLAKKVLNEEQILVVHARSYMPASIAYFLKKRIKGVRYLFDTRGFWFDEKADTGRWKRNGLVYRFAKKLERKLYVNAGHIVMLSEKSIALIKNNELFSGGNRLQNITFIPTCTNLDTFHIRREVPKKRIKIGYIGTAIGWYDFDKTARLLVKLKTVIDFDLELYNGGQHAYISETLEKHGFTDSYVLEKVPFAEIPAKMRMLDLSIFFIHPVFSKNASAATKLGELMASGVPVITNNRVGDHKELIESYKTGIIIDSNETDVTIPKEQLEALLQPVTKERCRLLAEDVFSLKKGVENYSKIYNLLLS